ncbi:MAG: AMP-binding protein, partial [Nitrospinota bacterium]
MHVGYLIQRSARYFRRRTAVVLGDGRLTFEEVDGRANRLCSALRDLGIGKGARVAILLHNCKEFVEADFGVSKGGFVKLLVSPRYTPEEIRFVLEDSGAECIIFGQEFEGTIDSIRGNLPSLKHLVRVGEERGEWLHYEALLAEASPAEPESDVAEEDLYEIKYTSGTTGRPKGAMFTHRAKIANVLNIFTDRIPISPEDKMLHVGSLAYASGFYMLPHFLRGAANVLLKRFDPEEIFETIQNQRITTLSIVPTMLYMMLAHPRVRRYDYSSLKAIYYGGAPMSTEKLKEDIAVFGNVFYQTYGLIEAPMSAHLPISEHKANGSERELKRMGSVGREITNAEIRIVDELGKEVKSGAVGQLIIRAPHAMAGYWNNLAETRRTLCDGWIFTGDVG